MAGAANRLAAGLMPEATNRGVGMPILETTINQLIASRHLLYLARQNIDAKQNIRLFAGVNLLHDAVEAFLWAATAHLNRPREKMDIATLLDAVDAGIDPVKLPFRAQVFQLNKVRINSKHFGLQPERTEVQRLLTSMSEFLREGSRMVFDVNYATVSMVDLLPDGDVKSHLKNAESHLQKKGYWDSIIESRASSYMLIDQFYNIDKFRSPLTLGLGAYSLAPYWTRSIEWIEKNVLDPFDYIQRDNDGIEKRLLSAGIPPETYWNLQKTAPDLYLSQGVWHVKGDLRKEAEFSNEETATYCLEIAVELALGHEAYNQRLRSAAGGYSLNVTIQDRDVPVYEKADRASPVVGTLGPAITTVYGMYYTSGIAEGDEGPFWKVLHLEDRTKPMAPSFFGYIHVDDVLAVNCAPYAYGSE